MTDDQFWRIAIGSGILGAIAAFRPQVDRFLYKLGYRKGPSETGWKRGLTIAAIGLGIVILLLVIP